MSENNVDNKVIGTLETQPIVENNIDNKVVETPEVAPIEEKEQLVDANESIFITENDTFTVTIQWYKDGKDIFVEGESTDFDSTRQDINEFTVTFKYPSQGDYEMIMNSQNNKSLENMSVSDIIRLEVTRMVTLVRSWSLKQNMDRMVQLDPNIIKSINNKVRNIIGMKGIL